MPTTGFYHLIVRTFPFPYPIYWTHFNITLPTTPCITSSRIALWGSWAKNRNTFLVSPCVLQRIVHLVLVGLLTPQYNGTSATGWFIWVYALTLNLHWCSGTSLTWIEQSCLSLMKSYMQWIECIVACITPPKAPELSARAAYGASNADQLRKRVMMSLNCLQKQ